MDFSNHTFSPNSVKKYNSEYSNYQDIIKNQEKIINQLKRTIEVYEKNTKNQNQKLSNHDALLIEYNSLLKNYSELENELSAAKEENICLTKKLKEKNQTLCEYQQLFESSKSKFELFEQTNNALKNKIEELESKLKLYPKMQQNNNDLNMKINEYESKLKLIKEECNKKEELFKMRLNNQEKISKNNSYTLEEEINQLKDEIKNLKNNLSTLKSKNNDLMLERKNLDNEWNMKARSKDNEIEKLTKMVTELKSNKNTNILNERNEIISNKSLIDKLKYEKNDLEKILDEKDQHINDLNMALNDADQAIQHGELELKEREDTINNLLNEKESLLKKLNDRQIDFIEMQNSCQQEVDILHNQVEELEKEKDILIADNDECRDQIDKLQQEINQYLSDDKIHFQECQEADKKYNHLQNAYKIKQREHAEQMGGIQVENNNLRTEIELLKSKYEKQIQSLILNNNELNTRVKNLINILISLKDYALTIERNMNEISLERQNNLSLCENGNLNYGFNNGDIVLNNTSREMLNNMKNIINQIDTKFINENINNNYSC